MTAWKIIKKYFLVVCLGLDRRVLSPECGSACLQWLATLPRCGMYIVMHSWNSYGIHYLVAAAGFTYIYVDRKRPKYKEDIKRSH